MRFAPDDLRAYAARDWRRLREMKRAYWRDRLARGGLVEAIRITELLRGTSSQEDREKDLQNHQNVADALAKTKARPRNASRTGRASARRVRRTR